MDQEVERARMNLNYMLQYVKTTYIYSILLVFQFGLSFGLLFYTLFTKIENFSEDFVFNAELILTICYFVDILIQFKADKKFFRQLVNLLDVFIFIVSFLSFLYFKLHFISNLIEDEENFAIISILIIRILVRSLIILYRHYRQVKVIANIKDIQMFSFNNQEITNISQYDKEDYEIKDFKLEH